jgi:hypothetical protein
MTQRERERADAFKVGFLRKLAELGVLPGEFTGHVKKAVGLAGLSLANLASGVLSSGSGLAGELGRAGLQGAVLAPLALGAATGATSGLLDAPSSSDIEELRKQELLELYKRLAKEVRLRSAMREVGV